jgi:hypothetical protein
MEHETALACAWSDDDTFCETHQCGVSDADQCGRHGCPHCGALQRMRGPVVAKTAPSKNATEHPSAAALRLSHSE